MERHGSQRKYSGANWPGEVGTVSPGMSVEMTGTRAEDEWWQNGKTSATLGTWRQKKARSTTCHLAGNMLSSKFKDLEKGGLSCEEAMSSTADWRQWRNWIAQCARHGED